MLADFKLPTTFWVEAVNTTCYVQNRVLVVKPHNKTPYELSRGRTYALSFMRPFGCHVTILNTLDYLGKFDGKSNKGFFVGYLLNNKAFRVFRNKKDERGIVIQNKARLVAQGHTQEEGIDYDEVFAPVARIEVIRMFLAYTSFMGFMVYQMDVKSAFLYDRIKEEVYVCQPPGFEDPEYPDKVYKVVKALYGLHQAPRAWYETLAKYLLDNGFHRGKIDQTLFIKKQKGNILLVQVYVDDIIFGSTKKELCIEFEKLMHDKFQMSSIGELTFLLGLQVKQKEDGIFISQDKYVADILRKFSFTDDKTTMWKLEGGCENRLLRRWLEDTLRSKPYVSFISTGLNVRFRLRKQQIQVDHIVVEKMRPTDKVVEVSGEDSGDGGYEVIKRIFDGAFGGVGDEEVVVGEGVVLTSSSLEMLTNSYLGGIIVNFIFLEGFEEEALVEFMVE
ncbi:putative ribonuclease H-like domain-containing protein [Tanacetum coccineum]